MTGNRKEALKVLQVNASGRTEGSISRMLSQKLVEALAGRENRIELVRRDVNRGIGFVDEDWINANFTNEEDRTEAQQEILADSDRLVAELQHTDVLVIGTPIYNFGIPASLKAWIDMIARARKTFRYTENGPKGLLEGKKAYIVIASGGVEVDSQYDFATPYLRQALSFIGITDVDVIAADQLNKGEQGAINSAHEKIADLMLIKNRPRVLAA